MNALDSPLEALAFNYLNYGFLTAVNSLWAWIAVVTAAVSFWKIRASSTPLISRIEGTSTLSPSIEESAEPSIDSAPINIEEKLSLSGSKTTSFCELERESSSKVKFSLYYNEEFSNEGDMIDETDDESDGEDERIDDWERLTVEMRMGDMGWYRCQDLTVLNGSVVRLWDGARRR